MTHCGICNNDIPEQLYSSHVMSCSIENYDSEEPMSKRLPAQQDWVCELSIMMQSVLFAAIRAPDGLRKNHPVKVLLRWYRRSILLSAFDGAPINNPFTDGGGSFTGPFTVYHAQTYLGVFPKGDGDELERAFSEMREVYLEHVDELPHHFQLHFMHAAQIVGEFHPIAGTRNWWKQFYLMIVNDAHLHPESREELCRRLSDNERLWREREVVTAK